MILDKVKSLPERPCVFEVSRALQMSEEAIRLGLQTGALPFGVAIRREGSSKYAYYLFRDKILRWMNG